MLEAALPAIYLGSTWAYVDRPGQAIKVAVWMMES
jgi:hypothetical protein